MNNDDLDLNLIWKTALGELEVVLTKATFTTWFKGTILDSFSDGVFTVGVPNFFYRDWLNKNCLQVITKALKNAYGSEPKAVKIKVVSSEKLPSQKPKKSEVIHTPVDNSMPAKASHEATKQTVFDQQSRYTFEAFIVGANNRLAHAAALAVSENPGKAYNPLYIYGPSGLGKTHLLKAIENQIKKHFPDKSTLYTSSETFTNDFINSIRTDSGSFRNRYRGTDVLIVDDIQFIGGKEGTQEEFFHTFNFLHQNNKQVVLASDRVPRAIKGLEDRLITRFEWGMLADISKPDLETRNAILIEKCHEKDFQLSEDIISFIASHVTSSIRELEGALNKIIAEARLNKVEPSLALAESVLRRSGDKETSRGTSPSKIFRAVSGFFNIKHDDLVSKKRNKELIKPRQLCMYLLRTEASLSFPEIAREMGGKDHSTIMYGCKNIEKNLATDEEIKNELALLKDKLRTAS
jgi:chromosomal replication initiator protein